MNKLSAILCCYILLSSCQDRQSNTIKTTKVAGKQKTETVKKRTNKNLDTTIISQKNVVTFLTQYGKQHPENKVILETRLGNITILLYKNTPFHRANFIFLAKKGYFNTTCFHRVVNNFIIQAGQSDAKATLDIRKQIGFYKIPPEFTNHKHHKGALSAARRWNQNPNKLSDPYEFFIVHDKNGLTHLNQEHTVFGKIIAGMDVLDAIAKEKIDKGEWPLSDIHLKVRVF